MCSRPSLAATPSGRRCGTKRSGRFVNPQRGFASAPTAPIKNPPHLGTEGCLLVETATTKNILQVFETMGFIHFQEL